MLDLRTRYESLYCALYNGTLERWNGDQHVASLMTSVGLAGAVTANVLVVLTILRLFRGPAFVPRWLPLVVLAICLVLNYAHFLRDKRYVGLARRFDGTPSTNQRSTIRTAWLYVILSYLSPLILVLIISLLKRG